MSERVEAVVIGAGVVGLACARALARAGRETLILERHEAFGTEISARNSEVIHAGIYYPTGSAKARLCAAGRSALYRFCEDYGVSHRRCGKLIVASHPDQHDALAAIRSHAESNGVTDIHTLSADEARALEPNVNCSMALLSSSTGIVDSHSLMQALLGDAERHGAVLALKSPLAGGRVTADGIVLRVDGVEPIELTATLVVNAAGLSATAVATSIEGFPAASIPRAWMAKGNYFTLSGKAPFSRLVYPVPEPGGLGVHLTLDLAGQARFGPDVEWIDAIDYTVNPARGLRFYDEVRKYWPGLPDGALQPAYAGIRPKISGPGMPNADFAIDGPKQHGVAGWINLFGIESPGLTSCLAIGDEVRDAIVAVRA